MIPERILEISRDPLFKAVFPERTSWVQTGRPLEPYGRVSGHADVERVGLVEAVAGLMVRRYGFVIFPALRSWGPGDPRQRWRAVIRRSLIPMFGSRVIARSIGLMAGLENVAYIIRDVSDIPDIDDAGLGILGDAALYSKREVLESDLGPVPGRPPVVYTPMPFDVSVYDRVGRFEKTTDVFYAARPNSELRQQAMNVVTRLSSEGFAVDVPQERLDFEQYLERMARASLVISPRGNGEHCWRHYEALLVGSVPVINYPLRPVHYELRHLETCLFYEPNEEDLRIQIVEGLSDAERLHDIARAGEKLVRSSHAKDAVCRLLLERAGYAVTG